MGHAYSVTSLHFDIENQYHILPALEIILSVAMDEPDVPLLTDTEGAKDDLHGFITCPGLSPTGYRRSLHSLPFILSLIVNIVLVVFFAARASGNDSGRDLSRYGSILQFIVLIGI